MTDAEFAKACLDGDATQLERLDVLIREATPNDDLRQALRHRLLVEKRLEQFKGRSSLNRWLKTVATRLEIDLSRKGREDSVDDALLEALLPPAMHGEAQLVQSQAREALKAALREALRALGAREQLYVQHAYLDGLTLTAIGRLYGVAPSTVMRVIDRSIAMIKQTARTHLARNVQLAGLSLESLVREGLKTL